VHLKSGVEVIILLNILFSDLNLLDWSVTNQLAVCLAGSVYLWNAATGDINQLMQVENREDYIGAVSWIKEGNYLAVGTSSGEVQVCFINLIQ
jgi:cell division cycle protein 20 (cofactor of APC complex)